jgi:hypothetical protein
MTSAHIKELVEVLRRECGRFGPELARLSTQRGLAFTNPDGTIRPLPISATPVVLPQAELSRRVGLAALLASAAEKMARTILSGPQKEMLLSGLSPLERQTAEKTFRGTRTLVTTRVDFFVGSPGGGQRGVSTVNALEVNATIPAMQGYSDIATWTFLEVVGRHFGLPEKEVAALFAQNGSNARALYEALLAGYQTVRPGKKPNAIALLCRRFDAQLTEQLWLRDRFRDFGADADVVHPDQLSGDDAVRANGKQYDLVYRHLFVRRLEEAGIEGKEYVTKLLQEKNGTRAVVLNPPASQIEEKLSFALLSQALEDAALRKEAGLSDDELEAVKASVPWTRPFFDPALGKKVAADPDRYVIKRSWDYGGRTVFVGRTRHEPSFVERVKAAYGTEMSWEALCEHALTDNKGGGFIVQELVETMPEPHVICTAEGQTPVDLYVDFSCYASVGLTPQPPWTGVCRGSVSHIVNLHGGGGMLPLLTGEVATVLHTALARR